MRNLRTLLIGGAAAVALAFGASALAKTTAHTQEMDVALPDGAIAHIQYTGDKPVVTVSSNAGPLNWFSDWQEPLWSSGKASTLRVPDIHQIMASVDEQMAAMQADIERFDRMAADPSRLTTVSGDSTAGTNFCAHSVAVTETGNGAPHVEERTYGNCGRTQGPSAAQSPALAATRT